MLILSWGWTAGPGRFDQTQLDMDVGPGSKGASKARPQGRRAEGGDRAVVLCLAPERRSRVPPRERSQQGTRGLWTPWKFPGAQGCPASAGTEEGQGVPWCSQSLCGHPDAWKPALKLRAEESISGLMVGSKSAWEAGSHALSSEGSGCSEGTRFWARDAG